MSPRSSSHAASHATGHATSAGTEILVFFEPQVSLSVLLQRFLAFFATQPQSYARNGSRKRAESPTAHLLLLLRVPRARVRVAGDVADLARARARLEGRDAVRVLRLELAELLRLFRDPRAVILPFLGEPADARPGRETPSKRRGADQLESSAHDGDALAPPAPTAPPTARTATRNIVAIMASGEAYEAASSPPRAPRGGPAPTRRPKSSLSPSIEERRRSKGSTGGPDPPVPRPRTRPRAGEAIRPRSTASGHPRTAPNFDDGLSSFCCGKFPAHFQVTLPFVSRKPPRRHHTLGGGEGTVTRAHAADRRSRGKCSNSDA